MTKVPRLLLLLLLFQLTAAVATGAFDRAEGEVPLIVMADEEGPVPIEVTLEVQPLDCETGETGQSRSEARVLTLVTGKEVGVPIPTDCTAELQVTADGFWGAPRILTPTDRRGGVVLMLHRTTVSRAEIQLPRGFPMPPSLRVSFIPTPGGSGGSPAGDLECPIEEGVLVCSLPRGVHDLRLHHPGFASVHRWGLQVGEEPVELKSVPLRPGSSLVGRVGLGDPVQEAPETDGKGAVEISLHPQSVGPRTPFMEDRLEPMVFATPIDERGFFQLVDVPAGVWEVRVEASGFAPLALPGIRVVEGRETDVGLLHLEPPVVVTFVVDPPLTPARGYWQLELEREGEVGHRIEGQADDNGFWEVTDLRPGRYRLSLLHGRALWHRQEVEILESGGLVPVEVDKIAIQGLITLGGEPIRARLKFLGVDSYVEMYSDFEGRFVGALPKPGEWTVQALLRRNGAWQTLDRVTVEQPSAGDPEWLEFEMADTRLVGRVVDEAGRPRERIQIRFMPDYSELGPDEKNARKGLRLSSARSDGDGEFEFRGLPPGPYRLTAFDPTQATAAAQVQLMEGEETEVELVLGESMELELRVVSQGRPVAGAMVVAYPQLPEWRGLGTSPKSTDADGRFSAWAPADAIGLMVAVMPPGYTARLVWLPADPNAVHDIEVHDLGGVLILDLPEDAERLSSWNLQRGGASLWLGFFEPWVQYHQRSDIGGLDATTGTTWVLPDMEIGPWQLCRPHGGPCAGGELTYGGSLRLEAPTEESLVRQ